MYEDEDDGNETQNVKKSCFCDLHTHEYVCNFKNMWWSPIIMCYKTVPMFSIYIFGSLSLVLLYY